VRSSFASDTSHLVRFVRHSPLKYLMTISPDNPRAQRPAERRPGSDWQPGGFYHKPKPFTLGFDHNGSVTRKLRERSEQLLAVAV
jgi:hypothetical protein